MYNIIIGLKFAVNSFVKEAGCGKVIIYLLCHSSCTVADTNSRKSMSRQQVALNAEIHLSTSEMKAIYSKVVKWGKKIAVCYVHRFCRINCFK